MKKLILCISLLPGLWLAQSIRAQDKPILVLQIEKAFTEKEPRWKIDRENEQTSPPVIHLKSGNTDTLIWINIMDSAKSASEAFEGGTIAFANIMGARGRKNKLPNFGDENYIWTGFGARATTSIHFRRGNIYIQIIAPSQVTAKRFAQHVMDQIIKHNKTQNVNEGAIQQLIQPYKQPSSLLPRNNDERMVDTTS
jgi:hypothetical protein